MDELREFIEGKNIILVGPAPILKGKGKGVEIDSYDVVVRTNHMLTALDKDPSLEVDYGSRCDILFLNSYYVSLGGKLWDVPSWKKRGLKHFCTNTHRAFPPDLGVHVTRMPYAKNIHQGTAPKGLLLGVKATDFLLTYPIKSLTIDGIDGYIVYNDYVEGYSFWRDDEEKRKIKENQSMKNAHHQRHSVGYESGYLIRLEREKKIILPDYVRESLIESGKMYGGGKKRGTSSNTSTRR